MVLHLYSMSGHSKPHTLRTAARLSATGLQAGGGKEDHLSTLLFSNTLDGKHRCPTSHSEEILIFSLSQKKWRLLRLNQS